jgi:hypothetical protein
MLGTCFMLISCLPYFFDPEDGGDMFLRNIGWLITDYAAIYPQDGTLSSHSCENRKRISSNLKEILSHFLKSQLPFRHRLYNSPWALCLVSVFSYESTSNIHCCGNLAVHVHGQGLLCTSFSAPLPRCKQLHHVRTRIFWGADLLDITFNGTFQHGSCIFARKERYRSVIRVWDACWLMYLQSLYFSPH